MIWKHRFCFLILVQLFLCNPIMANQIVSNSLGERNAIWGNKWSNFTIPVCWENPRAEYNDSMATVRNAIENTWNLNTPWKFTGWDSCPSTGFNGIRVLIDPTGWPRVKGLGRAISGQRNGMVLNFSYRGEYKCYRDYQECNRIIAVHEFGHALGLAHEQHHVSNVICGISDQGSLPDFYFTDYDLNSVMNYCNPIWSGNGDLSEGDIFGAKLLALFVSTNADVLPISATKEYEICDNGGYIEGIARNGKLNTHLMKPQTKIQLIKHSTVGSTEYQRIRINGQKLLRATSIAGVVSPAGYRKNTIKQACFKEKVQGWPEKVRVKKYYPVEENKEYKCSGIMTINGQHQNGNFDSYSLNSGSRVQVQPRHAEVSGSAYSRFRVNGTEYQNNFGAVGFKLHNMTLSCINQSYTGEQHFELYPNDYVTCYNGGDIVGQMQSGEFVRKNLPRSTLRMEQVHATINGVDYIRITVNGSILQHNGSNAGYRRHTVAVTCN